MVFAILHSSTTTIVLASTASSPFVIRHGKGRLLLPTHSPIASGSRTIQWQNGCGYGDRICGQATLDGQLVYLMGGTVSPEEAKSPHECETGARRDQDSGACVYKKDGVFTWTKRFGRVIVAISAGTAKLDANKLVRWLGDMRWEESK